MKANITRTIDRQIEIPGQMSARLAITLNLWRVPDISDDDLMAAMGPAADALQRALFDSPAVVEPICGNCRFFAEDVPRRCRRHAPVAGMGWPHVTERDSCGEFRPKDPC